MVDPTLASGAVTPTMPGITWVPIKPTTNGALYAAIAQIMGVEAEKRERRIATVRCRGSLDRCGLRFAYDGPKDCKSAALVAGGDKACE